MRLYKSMFSSSQRSEDLRDAGIALSVAAHGLAQTRHRGRTCKTVCEYTTHGLAVGTRPVGSQSLDLC